jgi:sugar-specific transcriptional regulator TrmB
MTPAQNVDEAVEILQQLGLKEYEARCFVGLTRLETGTAQELSEITEVPRTRVYDAVRVLEAQGLVEVRHSSPQQYRAVSLEEAAKTLQDRYEALHDRLYDVLQTVDPVETDDDSPAPQMWEMSGRDAIENRILQLLAEADFEIVLVVGEASLLTDELIEALNRVPEDVDLLVGSLSEALQHEIETAVPAASTFVSGLDWLHDEEGAQPATAFGRLVVADRSTILASSLLECGEETAMVGEGFGGGNLGNARRLMVQGMLLAHQPAE